MTSEQPGKDTEARRPPTMRDVAKRAGVSQQLVSLIFRNRPGASEETRQRVIAAAEDIGYRVNASARLLRRTRSQQVGVLFTMRQAFEAELAEALLAAARASGLTVVLGPIGPSEHAEEADLALASLLEQRIEALITLDLAEPTAAVAEAATRMPVVRLAVPRSDARYDDVRVDEAAALDLAVSHLARLGHRSIAHVGGVGTPGAVRRTAYEAAMRANGLAAFIRIVEAGFTEEDGARAARDLMKADDMPTALVCCNDRCAAGVMATLARDRISVPDDVSVVGLDDSSVAKLSYYDLTTVRQDAGELAACAIEAIVTRLEKPAMPPRSFTIAPSLVVRSSTGAPRDRNPTEI